MKELLWSLWVEPIRFQCAEIMPQALFTPCNGLGSTGFLLRDFDLKCHNVDLR